MGCFFRLEMKTWSDALLALSVVQAAAMDVKKRWYAMPPGHVRAASRELGGFVRTCREASTPTTRAKSTATRSGSRRSSGPSNQHPSTGSAGNRPQDNEDVMGADVLALRLRGVAGARPFDPPPTLEIFEAGHRPPANNWVRGLCVPAPSTSLQ